MRIERNAVAADAGAGRELHEAERLGGRRLDHLPDVDAEPSQTIAISLTKPMLTARKVFSSSLTSSAASGLDDRDDLLDAASVERRWPDATQAGVMPPTTLGVFFVL